MKAEERLSDALQTLAGQVEPSAAGYDRARREWQRRERRRRALVAGLAVAVIVAANGAALWALSSGDPEAHIVERRQEQHQLPVPGQP